MHKHTAINGNDLSMNSPFIKALLKGENNEYFPELKGKKGALYSNSTLAQFIEEEFRHDNFVLGGQSGRSIRSFSSGEQKKALLDYLMHKSPDFIVLDNPFDALDTSSVNQLKRRLLNISRQMPVIQVFKRKADLLPFINHAMRLHMGEVVFSGGVASYLRKYEQNKEVHYCTAIPAPLHQITEEFRVIAKFTDVSVNYNSRPILSKINWTIQAGEFWQLKGPNGSGKTTLLTMINGDNPKAFGQNIELFGRKKGTGESVWEIKKRIGYFTPSMMDLFTRRQSAMQMVISGFHDSIGLYQRPSEGELTAARRWLDLIHLSDYANRPFIELTQVQRRMVLIARAMIKHPPLLILDEPSTGLDDQSAALLSALINKIASESQSAILYVSHRLEPDLQPQFIYQLIPGKNGSLGENIEQ
ncbi:ATP-binding cassette domain-containing protein [uncultured Draconibacterium sp.]|uniref:ATP-binding cassette domain-containing protein n=1 Tax=uncultured Draconibacterium sp. TaxID=1573823 RepID=UPI0025DADD8A|nr:ATP-binding cassette domain-containing protein [uncultured Draconibacterium sp.]